MTLTLSLRPDVTVVAVLVPNEYNRFDAEMFWENDCMSFVNAKIPLPPGQYEIVGLLRDVKDDVLSELLVCQDSVLGPGLVFWSYSSESFTCPTAQSSIKGAIYKAGGDPEQNWLLIKKIQ